jgi:hypothetical protein
VLEDIRWLGQVFYETTDPEERCNAVRQVRSGAVVFPKGQVIVKDLYDHELDPVVRFELADLLAALGADVRKRHANVLAGVDLAEFKAWLTTLDGHDIVDPSFFAELGFSGAIVSAITDEWQALGLSEGVSTYHAVVYLAHELGLRPEKYFIGRGKHAKQLAAQILSSLP